MEAERRHLNDASKKGNDTHGCHRYSHQTSRASLSPGAICLSSLTPRKHAEDAQEAKDTLEVETNTMVKAERNKAHQGIIYS
jgi:hypothetical protein